MTRKPCPPSDDIGRAAAQAWAASQRERRGSCRMSPMDEMSYFQPPRTGEVQLQNATAKILPVVDGDPMRVRLIVSVHNVISLTQAGNTTYDFVAVSTVNQLINGCLQGGVILSISCCTQVITDEEFPGMVQMPWFVFYYPANVSVATAVLHFTEIRLKKWPNPPSYRG